MRATGAGCATAVVLWITLVGVVLFEFGRLPSTAGEWALAVVFGPPVYLLAVLILERDRARPIEPVSRVRLLLTLGAGLLVVTAIVAFVLVKKR